MSEVKQEAETSSSLVREHELIHFLQSVPNAWTLRDVLDRMPFWPKLTPPALASSSDSKESSAETIFRTTGFTFYPLDLQEKKTPQAWAAFLVDSKDVSKKNDFYVAYRKWRRETGKSKQNEIPARQILQIIRYLSPRSSLWSTRKRRRLSGLVRKNHELIPADTRYTISEWSRELFSDADAVERIPTDKANSIRISLVQYLFLILQILTRGLAGMHLRPVIPRRLIIETASSAGYALIPISFDQERVLFHRDYIQSSKKWSRLLSGPKIAHERRMSLDSYLEELRNVGFELPLRWIVNGPSSSADSSGVLLLPRNPIFFEQLCINPASYISLENWKSETQNLFLFYSPISGDWPKEQLRRAHCMSQQELRQALLSGHNTNLDKQVLLWTKQSEPNPVVRFYRLPGAEVWIDDASAHLLLQDSSSISPGLAAYFLLPIGRSSVGTIDALRGVASSFHGTEQVIYSAVPFLREWGTIKGWPAIFAWLYRFVSNLFSVESLTYFFQTIFIDLQTVAFQPFVNRLHTDMTVDSPFHPFEIIMFALTDRDRPRWNGSPSNLDMQSAIRNLASHYSTWRASENLKFGLRQTYDHITAMGQTLADAEVKLARCSTGTEEDIVTKRIRHHWTGFSKSVEPAIQALTKNTTYMSPFAPVTTGALSELVVQPLPLSSR